MVLQHRIDEARKKNEMAYRETSKGRLLSNISKKFDTCMIGSLASIEKYFGHMWGHESSRPLTKQEREYRKIWEVLRSEILTNGNSQKRASINEISEYALTWEKYKIDFIPVSNINGIVSIKDKKN